MKVLLTSSFILLGFINDDDDVIDLELIGNEDRNVVAALYSIV